MINLTLSFSARLKQRISEDLFSLNKAEKEKMNIAAIASTFHHETGELAFVLGYSTLEERPNVILAKTSEGVIAFHMPPDELTKFQNAKLDWTDGYVTGFR